MIAESRRDLRWKNKILPVFEEVGEDRYSKLDINIEIELGNQYKSII